MDELTNRLNEILCESIEKGQIAGANLLVLKDGKELVYTDAGYANIEKGKKYDRNTICRFYSMTKPITSAAAMILMERGQLEFGQSVGEFLESFKDMTVLADDGRVKAKRDIMVKDLMNMTSGLTYGDETQAGQQVWRILEEIDDRLYGDNPMSTMELAHKLGKCDLSFQPGEAWEYGLSADMMGAIIQKITGMPYGEFLKKEIFEPLGMEDTAFYVPEEKRDRFADVYESTEDGLKLCVTNHLGIKYTMDKTPAFESGGAGLASTIDDYSRFAKMLMNKGTYEGKQILKPKTVEYMTTGKLMPWQQDNLARKWEHMQGYGYGNLMRVMEEPGRAEFNTWKGEYGWDGWLGTYFCNSPSNRVTILLTCQKKHGGTMEVTKKLRNVLAANID